MNMAKGEQQARKKRKVVEPAKAGKKRQLEEEQPVPQQAAAPQDVGPSGWEELEQPQDVQQQAGAPPGTKSAAQPHHRNKGAHRNLGYTREHACMPVPPLAAAAAAAACRCAALPACPWTSAEPQAQQQQEPRKLSKLQKRRVKEDRERAIRKLEMKKLEVRKHRLLYGGLTSRASLQRLRCGTAPVMLLRHPFVYFDMFACARVPRRARRPPTVRWSLSSCCCRLPTPRLCGSSTWPSWSA